MSFSCDLRGNPVKNKKYYYVEEILDAENSLRVFPKRGRIVPEINDENIRELFIKEYRLIYQIENKEVNVLCIVHGRRDLRNI